MFRLEIAVTISLDEGWRKHLFNPLTISKTSKKQFRKLTNQSISEICPNALYEQTKDLMTIVVFEFPITHPIRWNELRPWTNSKKRFKTLASSPMAPSVR